MKRGLSESNITLEAPIDTIDTTAEALTEGKLIQVWRSGQWLVATYLQAIGRSVLSHRTQRLDDGHQVIFPNDADLPKPVAFADIRLLLSSG